MKRERENGGKKRGLKVDIFYLWQISKKSGDWIDFNIIGVKLKVEF